MPIIFYQTCLYDIRVRSTPQNLKKIFISYEIKARERRALLLQEFGQCLLAPCKLKEWKTKIGVWGVSERVQKRTEVEACTYAWMNE